MFGLGTTELLILVFVIVLLFGANKLPQLGEGIGVQPCTSCTLPWHQKLQKIPQRPRSYRCDV